MRNIFVLRKQSAKEYKAMIHQSTYTWLHGISNSVDISLSKLQEIVKDREACCTAWGGKGQTRGSNWINASGSEKATRNSEREEESKCDTMLKVVSLDKANKSYQAESGHLLSTPRTMLVSIFVHHGLQVAEFSPTFVSLSLPAGSDVSEALNDSVNDW